MFVPLEHNFFHTGLRLSDRTFDKEAVRSNNSLRLIILHWISTSGLLATGRSSSLMILPGQSLSSLPVPQFSTSALDSSKPMFVRFCLCFWIERLSFDRSLSRKLVTFSVLKTPSLNRMAFLSWREVKHPGMLNLIPLPTVSTARILTAQLQKLVASVMHMPV